MIVPTNGSPPKSCTQLMGCFTQSPVGASLLAKDVNDNACCLNERGVQTSFASRLAPTDTTPGC
ncbi:hypothetical protein C1Y11_07100 [Pseudomonas sp. FW305-20]|nr:hypothetical protein C1Y11_07100 [Pseudomonas sp. FW305-20]